MVFFRESIELRFELVVFRRLGADIGKAFVDCEKEQFDCEQQLLIRLRCVFCSEAFIGKMAMQFRERDATGIQFLGSCLFEVLLELFLVEEKHIVEDCSVYRFKGKRIYGFAE